MSTLHRDHTEATHSLFVLDRQSALTQFAFVHERTGDVTTFRAIYGDGRASIVRNPDGAAVHLRRTASGRIERRLEGEDGVSLGLPADGAITFPLASGMWQAAWDTDGHLAVSRSTSPERLVAQRVSATLDGTSAAYDIWAFVHDRDATTGLGLVAEALLIRHLLLAPRLRFPRPNGVAPAQRGE